LKGFKWKIKRIININKKKTFHFLPLAKQRISARLFPCLRREHLQLCLINNIITVLSFPLVHLDLTLPLILIKCATYRNMIRHRINLIACFVSSIYCISRAAFLFFRSLHALDGDYRAACLLLTDNRSRIHFSF